MISCSFVSRGETEGAGALGKVPSPLSMPRGIDDGAVVGAGKH